MCGIQVMTCELYYINFNYQSNPSGFLLVALESLFGVLVETWYHTHAKAEGDYISDDVHIAICFLRSYYSAATGLCAYVGVHWSTSSVVWSASQDS